jgi:hypothetical protein
MEHLATLIAMLYGSCEAERVAALAYLAVSCKQVGLQAAGILDLLELPAAHPWQRMQWQAACSEACSSLCDCGCVCGTLQDSPGIFAGFRGWDDIGLSFPVVSRFFCTVASWFLFHPKHRQDAPLLVLIDCSTVGWWYIEQHALLLCMPEPATWLALFVLATYAHCVIALLCYF